MFKYKVSDMFPSEGGLPDGPESRVNFEPEIRREQSGRDCFSWWTAIYKHGEPLGPWVGIG